MLAMAPFCLGQQEPVIAPPLPTIAPKAPETKTQTPERVPGPATHALTKTDAEAWLMASFHMHYREEISLARWLSW